MPHFEREYLVVPTRNLIEKSRNKNIKIRVLQSARESKEDVKKYAEEIQKYLGKQYTNRILGFSIFVKKWRKARE